MTALYRVGPPGGCAALLHRGETADWPRSWASPRAPSCNALEAMVLAQDPALDLASPVRASLLRSHSRRRHGGATCVRR